MLVSGIQQSDSVIYVCIYMVYTLLQDIEHSSLCYGVGPCCFTHSLSNSLHLLIPNSQSISPPVPSPLETTGLFSMLVSLSVS